MMQPMGYPQAAEQRRQQTTGGEMVTQNQTNSLSNMNLYGSPMQSSPASRNFSSIPQQQQYPSSSPRMQVFQSPNYQQMDPQPALQQQNQDQLRKLAHQQQQFQTIQSQSQLRPGVMQSASHALAPYQMETLKKPETKMEKPLNPPPYSPQVLNNLHTYSIGSLAMIGRELVHEFLHRSYGLMSVLLKPIDRRNVQNGDPIQLLEYCEYILTKIVEIRIRIDQAGPLKSIDTEEFIKMLSESSPYKKPALLVEKEEEFENGRKQLVKLNSALKKGEWMVAVSDPRHFKTHE